MHAGRRVLLLRKRVQGVVWSLRSGHADLHALHRKSRSPALGEADPQSPIRRYADVLAHRQLAAAINYTPLHPSLQSKQHVEKTMSVVNKRHRLAQMASRASTEFYVGLALKGKGYTADSGSREEAFVIRTFRNGIAVFVSR